MTKMTIADQVAEMGRAMAEQPANPAMEIFAAEQRSLREGGLPAGIVAAGTPLPDATLIAATGDEVRLRDAVAGAPAVVVLYRGVWCPFCNLALTTYQRDLEPALAERGARLVAISPQRPDGSLSMQDKNELSFAVLSDPGNAVATALGVTVTPGDDVLAAQRELGLDLTEANADGTVTIPMPTTVVVDAEGTIRWIDVHPDYSTRSEVADILAALDEVVGR
jgi:peroxiredoxin